MKLKTIKPITIITAFLGLFIIVALFNTWQTSTQDLPLPANPTLNWTASPARPPWCKPPPSEPVIEGTATSTPNIFTSMVPVYKTERPTRTPYPIAHIVDLAPDLPLEDKGTALVFRCNGEMDQYLFGYITYSELLEAINLGEGDKIINSAPPASMMKHAPPPLIPTMAQTPITLTPFPYPIGQLPQGSVLTSTITQTQNPYP